MNEWISVKDRLPNEKGEYLCYFQASYGEWINISKFSFNLEEVDSFDFYGKNRNGWYGYDSEWGYFERDNITHWMPLPEAPKEEV